MIRIMQSIVAALGIALVAGCISVRVEDVVLNRNVDTGNETGFLLMETRADNETQPAVLYVPADYDPAKEWPLVVFLHGLGERGSDGWRQTEVGIGKAIRWNPDRFPCLVFMPQCSRSTVWSAIENDDGGRGFETHR